MKPLAPDQKLPRRFVVRLSHFRRFRWKERLKILFGYNALIECDVKIDKRDQQVWDHCALTLTKETNVENQRKQDHDVR